MRTTIVALALLASSTAFAQTRAELPEELAIDESKVTYAATTEIEFGELEVGGTANGPGIDMVSARSGPANFPPLFKLRASFNAELAQSANQVR